MLYGFVYFKTSFAAGLFIYTWNRKALKGYALVFDCNRLEWETLYCWLLAGKEIIS